MASNSFGRDEDYANDITAERVKRVTKGYGSGNKKVKGQGTFDFYELGLPLFDENENLYEEVACKKSENTFGSRNPHLI